MFADFSVKTSLREIKIAKLYLFFLPFRMIMPLVWMQDFIGPLANSFDLVFHIYGLLLWSSNEGGFFYSASNRSLFGTIKGSIVLLNLSSMFMSIVMFTSYGNLHGASPFFAIIPMMLFYFQYLFMFLYNIRVFSILDYGTIVKQIKKSCRVLLCLAYIQIAVMMGIGGGLYDAIVSVIGGFNTSDRLPKLCLTVSEGAAAGSLMGVFVFPFLFGRYIHGDKKAQWELLLWLIPLYFTHSSTAMLLFFCCFLVFLFEVTKKGRSLAFKLTGLGILSATFGLILMYTGVLGDEVLEDINYLLFEKATDQENGSTISRQVSLIINWGCFTEMPLFGVGNGLQGYFFNKYFPMEFLYVAGSDVGDFFEIAQTGISNGGCFWPGYLSGYGIFGLLLLLNLVTKLIKQRKSRSRNLGLFNEMFIMGAICFIPLGMQGEAYCLYYAWFVLAIPFMYFQKEELENA